MLALKCSWNYGTQDGTRPNPNTSILGMSNASTPILGIEDGGITENVTRQDNRGQAQ
jgi:hypothetical protein